ncbi:hypothetical protein LQZ21_06525 [Treponema sp. TIM-1]
MPGKLPGGLTGTMRQLDAFYGFRYTKTMNRILGYHHHHQEYSLGAA